MNSSLIDDDDKDLASLITRRQTIVRPSAPKCSNCKLTVYVAEEVRAENKVYHKNCFKCGKLFE